MLSSSSTCFPRVLIEYSNGTGWLPSRQLLPEDKKHDHAPRKPIRELRLHVLALHAGLRAELERIQQARDADEQLGLRDPAAGADAPPGAEDALKRGQRERRDARGEEALGLEGRGRRVHGGVVQDLPEVPDD